MTFTDSLSALLRPRSIAIIGASNDPTRIGGRPLRHLKNSGYEGGLYPINPGRSEVQGVAAYPSLDAVEASIDCAVIALASDAVLPAVEQCAARGVKSVVLFSAGFAEMGEAGKQAQARITEIARETGMRVVGPNCLGVFNTSARVYLTSTDLFQPPQEGRHIGLVSQSGGFGSHVLKLAQQRGLNVGKWITTGNECDVEFGEALATLADDPEVSVLLGYIEGIRSKDSFVKALEIARRHRKPVVLMKVGQTEEGASAAASHTASLAGADPVYNAIFQAYGVHRAHNTEELLDVAYALSRAAPPTGNRLGVITPSGGIGAQIADFASESGLQLASVPEHTSQALIALSPNASTGNPVDITGQYMNNLELVQQSVGLLIDSGAYDVVLAFLGLNASVPNMEAPLLESLARLKASRPDKLVVLCMEASDDTVHAYERAGFLVYGEPWRATRAIAALCRFGAFCARMTYAEPSPQQLDATLLPAGVCFNEVEAKAIIERCGIRLPAEKMVSSKQQAAAAAADMGFPVAIKVVSRDLAHKTDVGGVALGLADTVAVEQAMESMATAVTTGAPHARIDGYLVSPMVRGGVECIIGVHTDPLFGPIIMFGLGGIFVEIMKDAALRPAPVTESQAREMIQQIRAYPLLTGYRGKPVADIDALARAISRISVLAAANADRINTLEINPILVMPEGEGIIALDAVLKTVDPVPGGLEDSVQTKQEQHATRL